VGKIIALWTIELNCECPECEEVFDVIDQDDDFYAGGRQVGEHETPRSSEYETVCPNCQHEFKVDFQL